MSYRLGKMSTETGWYLFLVWGNLILVLMSLILEDGDMAVGELLV